MPPMECCVDGTHLQAANAVASSNQAMYLLVRSLAMCPPQWAPQLVSVLAVGCSLGLVPLHEEGLDMVCSKVALAMAPQHEGNLGGAPPLARPSKPQRSMGHRQVVTTLSMGRRTASIHQWITRAHHHMVSPVKASTMSNTGHRRTSWASTAARRWAVASMRRCHLASRCRLGRRCHQAITRMAAMSQRVTLPSRLAQPRHCLIL